MNRRAAAALFFLHAVAPMSVYSVELVVIHDSGQTVGIAQYVAPFYDREERHGDRLAPAPPDPLTVPPAVTFPIHTTRMAPSSLRGLPTTRLKIRLTHPVFLVGVDPISVEWLTRNRGRLIDLGAAGTVVNAPTLEAFRSIQAVGRGLPIAFGSMDELATQWGLKVYPILIQADGVIVQ
jgi:integrating conjugative element protein (TIGR03765 family)